MSEMQETVPCKPIHETCILYGPVQRTNPPPGNLHGRREEELLRFKGEEDMLCEVPVPEGASASHSTSSSAPSQRSRKFVSFIGGKASVLPHHGWGNR